MFLETCLKRPSARDAFVCGCFEKRACVCVGTFVAPSHENEKFNFVLNERDKCIILFYVRKVRN